MLILINYDKYIMESQYYVKPFSPVLDTNEDEIISLLDDVKFHQQTGRT